MKLISHQLVKSLNISPSTCVDWVKESFLMKDSVELPPKISLHPQHIDFFNTMPCFIPRLNIFSLKLVHRIRDAVPALGGDMWLYDSRTGELLSMLDCDWITTMRTGAVATLAAQTFRKQGEIEYGIMGLGNTGRATILCLLDSEPNTMHKVHILKYKDQAISFVNRLSNYKNVEFDIIETSEELIEKSDVVFSCVTEAHELFCSNNSKFKPGCLVIPVHTRGFQNCDLFFDKVFADDEKHVCSFKYFDKFKYFAEISDVLKGKNSGRENDKERIMSYNIGIGLHDAVFAWKIYNLLKDQALEITINKEENKFWI